MRSITAYAQALLLGTSIEEKLAGGEEELSWEALEGPSDSPFAVPLRPGRDPNWICSETVEFPSLSEAHSPLRRGQMLHAFANHELQAIELMALALIQFPNAPLGFRKGVLQTLRDEQRHFRLYQDRMKALGVMWGQEPISHFFWDHLRKMSSPLQYVTAMGLTLEQANLDFAIQYARIFEDVGDAESAEILRKIQSEEVSHVKHALHWFRKWSAEAEGGIANESEFDAHERHLLKPWVMVRARGRILDEASRIKAGFTGEYIRQMKLQGGSKGRPPRIWFYDPFVEMKNAPEGAAFSPSVSQAEIQSDLEGVLLMLADSRDVVTLQVRPSVEHLERLARLGLALPEIRASSEITQDKISGVIPWGWSPSFWRQCANLNSRVVPAQDQTPIFQLNQIEGFQSWFSKTHQQRFYQGTEFARRLDLSPRSDWGSAAVEIESALGAIHALLDQNRGVVLKAPFGASGMNIKRITSFKEVTEALRTWMERVIQREGSIWVEPLLDRCLDFSVQAQIQKEGRVSLLGLRQFHVGAFFQYESTMLGPQLAGLSSSEIRFVRQHQEVVFEWVRILARQLYVEGYRGPMGVDSFLYRRPGEDGLYWRVFGELNLRYTFGRVALEIERKLKPPQNSRLKLLRKHEYLELEKSPGFQGTPLTDPSTAYRVVACLLPE